VVVTVNIAFVFIITVLGAEHSGTDRAGKMLDVVFPVKCGYIRTAKSAAALETKEVQPSEVVHLAERDLVRA
jgi:hypothetical protein